MVFFKFNRKAKLFCLAFFIFFLFTTFSVAAKNKTFIVEESIKDLLVSLVDTSVHLHQSVYDQNISAIELNTLKLLKQVQWLRANIHHKAYHYQEAAYLDKLLLGLEFNLEAFRKSKLYKKNYIKSINRKLTYIAHIYGVKKYTVFFCAADRSVWLQDKKNKPFHLSHARCGIPVSSR